MDAAPVGMTPERLKAWRRTLGLTQAEAAQRLGLRRRVLQYYESGIRNGQPVAIPLTVRLACWAVTQGVSDWDGATGPRPPADDQKSIRA